MNATIQNVLLMKTPGCLGITWRVRGLWAFSGAEPTVAEELVFEEGAVVICGLKLAGLGSRKDPLRSRSRRAAGVAGEGRDCAVLGGRALAAQQGLWRVEAVEEVAAEAPRSTSVCSPDKAKERPSKCLGLLAQERLSRL